MTLVTLDCRPFDITKSVGGVNAAVYSPAVLLLRSQPRAGLGERRTPTAIFRLFSGEPSRHDDRGGAVCLAAAYLEREGDNYRYRYAVLCGGEAAKRALRTAVLDPGDCDEPGSGRRIALATYADYDDFVYRLPKFIAHVTRSLEDRIQQTEEVELQIRTARRRLSAAKRSAPRVGA